MQDPSRPLWPSVLAMVQAEPSGRALMRLVRQARAEGACVLRLSLDPAGRGLSHWMGTELPTWLLERFSSHAVVAALACACLRTAGPLVTQCEVVPAHNPAIVHFDATTGHASPGFGWVEIPTGEGAEGLRAPGLRAASGPALSAPARFVLALSLAPPGSVEEDDGPGVRGGPTGGPHDA